MAKAKLPKRKTKQRIRAVRAWGVIKHHRRGPLNGNAFKSRLEAESRSIFGVRRVCIIRESDYKRLRKAAKEGK